MWPDKRTTTLCGLLFKDNEVIVVAVVVGIVCVSILQNPASSLCKLCCGF